MKTIKTWLTTIAVLLYNTTLSAYDFKVDGIFYNILSATEQMVEVTWDNSSTTDEWPSSGAYYDEIINIPSAISHEGVKYSVRSIGDYAFSRCRSIISITIPDGVTNIGKKAFSGCWELASLAIPQSVVEIGMYAFDNCLKLLSIDIPKNITKIDESTFNACLSITSIIIPESVKEIGKEAFSNCKSLTSVHIPEGVVSIGEYAFRNCDNLTLVSIPKSVNSIGNGVFFQSANLKKVFWMRSTLPKGGYAVSGAINYTANSEYSSDSRFKVYPLLSNMFEVDGITYVPTDMSSRTCDVVNYDYDKTTSLVDVNSTVSYRNLLFSVNEVNDYTFYNNQHVKEVTLANQGGVGAYAMANCTALTSTELAVGVTSVGDYVFNGCPSLESIALPEGLVSIGDNAFNGCDKLSSFILPSTVSSIGYALFANTNAPKSLSVANGNVKYDSRNNCNAIIETETNVLLAACNQTSIPKSVKAIGDYAFSGCNEMTAVNIHENISSIGDYAFSGCSSLADVVIENRTEVLTLGSNGNKGLFADCPLDSVYIGGKISYNTSSSKGYSPFSNNTTLRAVTITDKEETIYPYEFYNCSALKDLIIGDGVTSIGDYAFSGCSLLENFAFGASMKTIGDHAFSGCGNLTSIASGAVNPPTCGRDVFSDISKWDCTLYVPVGYMAPYQAADQWKEFLFVDDIIPIKRYAMTYMVNDTIVYHVDSLAYEEAIVLPEAPTKEGYTFDGWVGVPETMPIHDVTANALFTINKYVLSYVVDGEVHMADSITYGDSIVALAPLEREGHTFSGWIGVPETMPANDTTVVGSFVVNSYLLIYRIDGDTIQSDSIAYGTAITMLEAPAKSGYSFDGWDTVLSVMPAEDVTINGSYTRLPIENFFIRDSNECFTSGENLQCDMITYTRNFTNTAWQSLYVPFEIPVTEEFLANFEIADINNVHQYDHNDDNMTDETVVEAFMVTSGTLEANYPYFIRAKEAGEKTITVNDATLYTTEENSIDCSSVREKFTFTGTYNTKSSDVLIPGEGYYTLINGEWQPVTEETTLGAFRFYLKVDSRSGAPAVEARTIRMRIVGEHGNDDDTTGIENLHLTIQNSQLIYDLTGRRVEKPTKGIYIVGGKRVVIK